MNSTAPRDNTLLDALEALPIVPLETVVWRVVREGRDPCRCSGAGNRWDNGEFEVLYTACDRLGAIAEMRFHLRRGQPVFPSKLRYTLHEIRVSLDGVYDLSEHATLELLGLNLSQYGQMSFVDRNSEYPSSQQIADAAHFLGSAEPGEASGLLVPSARFDCSNLVIFCDHTIPSEYEEIANHGVIDWND